MAGLAVPTRPVSARLPVQLTARPRPTSRAEVRLTRRGRNVVRLLVILVTLLLAMVGYVAGSAVSRAGDTTGGPATTRVVVQPGQTLWSIAAGVLPGVDAREAVARVADLNGLEPGAGVVPGQSLVLPLNG